MPWLPCPAFLALLRRNRHYIHPHSAQHGRGCHSPSCKCLGYPRGRSTGCSPSGCCCGCRRWHSQCRGCSLHVNFWGTGEQSVRSALAQWAAVVAAWISSIDASEGRSEVLRDRPRGGGGGGPGKLLLQAVVLRILGLGCSLAVLATRAVCRHVCTVQRQAWGGAPGRALQNASCRHQT